MSKLYFVILQVSFKPSVDYDFLFECLLTLGGLFFNSELTALARLLHSLLVQYADICQQYR